MKTIGDAYRADDLHGPAAGYSFKVWLSHIPGFYLECCKTGILFTFPKDKLDMIKPGDPCVCLEYQLVLEESSKQSIRDFGIEALANLRLAMAGRPTSIGRSIYEGSEVPAED